MLGEQECGVVWQSSKRVGLLFRSQLHFRFEEPHDKEAARAADRTIGMVSCSNTWWFEYCGKPRWKHQLAWQHYWSAKWSSMLQEQWSSLCGAFELALSPSNRFYCFHCSHVDHIPFFSHPQRCQCYSDPLQTLHYAPQHRSAHNIHHFTHHPCHLDSAVQAKSERWKGTHGISFAPVLVCTHLAACPERYWSGSMQWSYPAGTIFLSRLLTCFLRRLFHHKHKRTEHELLYLSKRGPQKRSLSSPSFP